MHSELCVTFQRTPYSIHKVHELWKLGVVYLNIPSTIGVPSWQLMIQLLIANVLRTMEDRQNKLFEMTNVDIALFYCLLFHQYCTGTGYVLIAKHSNIDNVRTNKYK